MNKRPLFTRRTRCILAAALILAIVLAVLFASGHGFLKDAAGTLMQPARSVSAAITRQCGRIYDYLFRYELLETENTALRTRIAEMEDEIKRADQLARENERLRDLLGLAEEHTDYTLVSAYITSQNGSAWHDAFTIGKGENAGLQRNMCVVDQYGHVIGLITEVGTNWANVTTLLNADLRISAQISSSGYTGVAQGAWQTGERERLLVRYLPSDAIVATGDQVVTTGSNLYPKGLLLGYVTDVDTDATALSRVASMEPAVRFDHLEQVFIITDYHVE